MVSYPSTEKGCRTNRENPIQVTRITDNNILLGLHMWFRSIKPTGNITEMSMYKNIFPGCLSSFMDNLKGGFDKNFLGNTSYLLKIIIQ